MKKTIVLLYGASAYLVFLETFLCAKRHPIMQGLIITFWATPVMTLRQLIVTTNTTLYILIAVKFLEEIDLQKMYLKQYEAYQEKSARDYSINRKEKEKVKRT